MLERIRRYAASSPHQTFVMFPALAFCAQIARGRTRRMRTGWLALWIAGYALYRVAGEHRLAEGARSRGFAEAPDRLVTTGPYAWSRNPMYLGHLISLSGLALATGSPIAVAALIWQWRRLARRIAVDEERLERTFGDEYRDYVRRIPRWFPTPTSERH